MLNDAAGFFHVPAFLIIYAMGAFGSLAIECATLVRDLGEADGVLPPRYRRWSYPIVRALFVFFAAAPLAVILDAQSIAAAFYIGVSAPVIYDRLASGITSKEETS